MDLDICVVGITLLAATLLLKKSEKRPRTPTDPYLLNRQNSGRFARDFQELTRSRSKFKENFRMDVTSFEKLLALLEPFLQPKRHTRPKDEITPREKLASVLEYLASGTLQRHVASVYRISKQHFGVVLDEVCDPIEKGLSAEIPSLNRYNLLSKANIYFSKWNFPNCVGAIDGKHVMIKCPKNAGSLFYNYKGYHSIVLMAVADATYKFSYVDIGAFGSEGDASIFTNSKLGSAIIKNEIDFPMPAKVGNLHLPFFFVGDDAFPLGKHIMKPYKGRKYETLSENEKIFNYRLSRARRYVENAFGILCSRWFCLAKKMYCHPERAQKIMKACCYLHNFLMDCNLYSSYCPPGYADYYSETGELTYGLFRQNISEVSLFNTNITFNHGRPHEFAKDVRNALRDYVNSEEGSIPWQRQACGFE